MRTMNRYPGRLGQSLLLAGVLALSGCSLAPTYERPTAPLADSWGQAGNASAPRDTVATLDWQAFVTDEPLRELIRMALSNNRDLRQTLLDVEAARAQYGVQRADRLPGLDAQGSGNRGRTPADLNPAGQAGVQSTWQAGVGMAAFELDLFGRVRNLSQAALDEFLATQGAAQAAHISLVGEVIQAYLTRQGAQQRHALTAQTLQAREASLALVSQRRAAGVASALDFQEARGLTEQAKADLESTERDIRQASHALGLLVGVNDIGAYLPVSAGQAELLVQDIAPGVPSDLLVYRPDIQAAEHRLRARYADIGAARAAFFPRISLTGMFGSASAELSNLFDAGQRSWAFAPQIGLPIFAGGRNRANLDLAEVRRDIAVAEYEKRIQSAFREVSDALAAADTLRRQEQAQRALADSSQQAMRLAEARYRGGVDGYLRYLEAQRHALANQVAAIEVSTQRQIALATLFKTLGGGWQDTGMTLAQ